MSMRLAVPAGSPAEERYPLARQPFSLGGLTLRNRLFQSAHTTNFGASDRSGPTARHVAYHRARARGGVSLIITEGIRPYAPTWRKGRMGAFSDEALPDFAALVAAVNDEGCALFAQLNDPGRHLRLDRMAPISASALPWAHGGAVPHALTVPEIGLVVRSFADGARRMHRAGFQGIELQCGHGHLINQFLSPVTNVRTDRYGGSEAGRLAFLLEVLEAVSSAVPIPVGIRISAEEFLPGGLGLDDTLRVVAEVTQRLPVDFLHVSHSFYAGSESLATQVADMSWPSAPFRHLPRAFKSAFPDIPVLAICRMDDLDVAESVLAAGDADLVGMARPQIADPELVAKSLSGRRAEVRHCIACNQGCIGRSESGSPISCVVNPRVGLEAEVAAIPAVPPGGARRVAVVGGGPAGMEAALTAARRGHRVVVYEQEQSLGGQITDVSRLHGRDRFGLLVAEQERDLEAAGVTVRRGIRATGELLVGSADTVVIATGSTDRPAPIDGLPRTWSPVEALDGLADLGRRVVIVDEDGGWAAPILAEHLAHAGIDVHVLGPAASFAPNVTVYSRVAIESRLGALGVTVTPLRRVVRAEGDAVVLADALTGRSSRLEGVTAVVRCRPREASASVLDELIRAGFVGSVHLVGDAYAPRTALEAVYEGHLAGLAIGVEASPSLLALPTYRPPLALGDGALVNGGVAAPEGAS